MRSRVLLLSCFLVCLRVARAAENDNVPAAKGASWQEHGKKNGLRVADLRMLEKNKILVSHHCFKQVFDPYIKSELPLFITSDSLLNGLHVILEESIFRLERANANKLPKLLALVFKNLKRLDQSIKADSALMKRAHDRAQIVLGTALMLLADETFKPQGEVAISIKAEVERITKAEVKMKPEWLGPPDPD